MQGPGTEEDDLSRLMPKSAQALNASESTETNDEQALREYLELQKQKTQTVGSEASVPQEVFLPAYNRRRDRLASRRPGSGRQTTARSFQLSLRDIAANDSQLESLPEVDNVRPASSKKKHEVSTRSVQPAANENIPPGASLLEILAPVSKQRKTEREQRKRVGTGRIPKHRTFGLDLKQLPRRCNGTESETEWAARELQLAAKRSALRKQRQGSKRKSSGVGIDAHGAKGRKSLAVSGRGSMPGDRRKSGESGLARRKSMGGMEQEQPHRSALLAEDAKEAPFEAHGQGGTPEEQLACVNELQLDPEVAAEKIHKQKAGVNALPVEPEAGAEEVHQQDAASHSCEESMTDVGVDMDLDESDEEVEGPAAPAAGAEARGPDLATWTFNPLFNGQEPGNVPPEVQEPPFALEQTKEPVHQPQSAQRIVSPLLEAEPPKRDDFVPKEPVQNNSALPPTAKVPSPEGHENSPTRSQAESNIVKEIADSDTRAAVRSEDAKGEEAEAAIALADMNLNQGADSPTERGPQNEDPDFPALEGSPPPVSPVDSSESNGHNNSDGAEQRLALVVAERSNSRREQRSRPKENGPNKKKNRRLMLLHGRKSLADAGLQTHQGVRRTTRPRVPPLQWWRNETLVYERSHDSLPTIAEVVKVAPDPTWPRPEGRAAARRRQQKLKELTDAEEVLALSLKG